MWKLIWGMKKNEYCIGTCLTFISISAINYMYFLSKCSYNFVDPFQDQVVIIHCVQDTSSLTLHNFTLSIAFMFMYVIKLTLKIFFSCFFFSFSFHSANLILGTLALAIHSTQKQKISQRNEKKTIKNNFKKQQ